MNRNFMLLLISFVALFSSVGFAKDIQDLERENQVEIKSWLGEEQAESQVVSINEQIILYIEVATNRWFTAGTVIPEFEVADLVIPPRNMQATNFTENKNGVTWSRQRWEIRLFPQASGDYTIPPIGVKIQVATDDGNVAGTLYTPPLQFTAQLPSGFVDSETKWIAAPEVSLSQEWQNSSEQLEAGDSITRTVTIKSTDSLAMLIPNPMPRVAKPSGGQANSLYLAYPEPAKLEDRQNRGNYQSSRIDQEVYLLQTGGEIVFPDITLYWWDTKNGELKTLVAEGETLKVKHTLASLLKTYQRLIIGSVLCLLLLVVIALRIRKYYTSHPRPDWYIFYKTVRKGHWPQARTLLYRKLYKEQGVLRLRSYSEEKTWQSNSAKVQGKKVSAPALKALWKRIKGTQRGRFSLPRALPELDRRK